MNPSTRVTKSCEEKMTKIVMQTFTHEFFIESSKCWEENKKKLPNGQYKYSCSHVYPSGKRCGKSAEHIHNNF